MKLNINPKELLALYNVLYDRFDGSRYDERKLEDDEESSDETQLRQVYNRIKACIMASLQNKAVDPFESWEQGQKAKIAKLNEELDSVKTQTKDMATAQQPPQVLTAEDVEVQEDYPRKGPRPQMPRPGKFHGHRK